MHACVRAWIILLNEPDDGRRRSTNRNNKWESPVEAVRVGVVRHVLLPGFGSAQLAPGARATIQGFSANLIRFCVRPVDHADTLPRSFPTLTKEEL